MKVKRSKHAQNRIAYIVYSNPNKVSNLINQQGYEPPKNIHDLVEVTKQLVRRKGRRVVKELISLHPDRKAIIGAEKIKEDSFCGACSSHSYNADDNYCGMCGHSSYTGQESTSKFLDQLLAKSLKEVEELYNNLKNKSKKDPHNTNLAEEVRLVWNELRLRKKDTSEQLDSKSNQTVDATKDLEDDCIVLKPKEALVVLGLTLLAGGLIGSAWKLNQSAA